MSQKIIQFLFLIGLFLPTRVAFWMEREMIYMFIFLIPSVLILLYLQKKVNKIQLGLSILFNVLLIYFTLKTDVYNPLYQIGYYAVFFFAWSLTFLLDFSEIKIDMKWMKIILNMVSIVLIIFSLGIIFKIHPIPAGIVKFYSAFYDDLVLFKLYQGVPVSMFGTHSLAGFYMFIFFLLNFFTFWFGKNNWKYSYGINSLLFLFFLFKTNSTTGFVYLIISFVIILIYLYKLNKYLFIVAIVSLIFAILLKGSEMRVFELLKNNFFASDSKNGLMARFGENGVLYGAVQTVRHHPFSGTGYISIFGTYYIDSGITHYALRSSVVGMLIFYTMFYRFLKKNLTLVVSIVLFSIFMFFEIGFSNLLYFRTLFMMPFIVLYVKGLFENREFAKRI